MMKETTRYLNLGKVTDDQLVKVDEAKVWYFNKNNALPKSNIELIMALIDEVTK